MLYKLQDFDFDNLRFTRLERESGQQGKIYYAAEHCAFDTETTTFTEYKQSAMYIWQFAIEQDVIIGRTWSEFKILLYQLNQVLTKQDLHLIIYIHNISYDGHFMSGVYHFNDYEVFCTESRKILKMNMYKRFEFRCSYRLFNMGLDSACKKYNTDYKKLSGFDYSKRRFSDTELTEEELDYCVHDVLALVELIHNVEKLYNDNLYSIPLTATGYVRRELKQAMQNKRLKLAEIAPPYACHKLLRAAFRGGNTHANRYFSGEIVENVHSDDISSSYPAQQCTKMFPMYKWQEVSYNTAEIEDGIKHNAAFIIHVSFTNIELRNKYISVPYIPIAKCIKLHFPAPELDKGCCTDNGRLLQAAYIEIALTDIDYNIVMRQYKADNINIISAWRSWYAHLPQEWIDVNIQHFKAKTQLKDVNGQELYYMKAKNLLNAIYGDTVQDPCKQSIKFADCMYLVEEITGKEEEEEFYSKKIKAPYKLYQWGVWTTARAREALQEVIDIIDNNDNADLIYTDTDCAKYIGDVDLSAINDKRKKAALESGLYATDTHGITHYGGLFEHDGDYNRFITLGAKKYAYEDIQGKLHITVSGVNKAKGAAELASKGGLEAFKPGFVFTNSGKTESTYNDDYGGVHDIDGHKVEFTRNIVISDVSYTIGITDDYARLLSATADAVGRVKKSWLNIRCIK